MKRLHITILFSTLFLSLPSKPSVFAEARIKKGLPNALLLHTREELQLFKVKQARGVMELAKRFHGTGEAIVQAFIGHDAIVILEKVGRHSKTPHISWNISLLNSSFAPIKSLEIKLKTTPKLFIGTDGYIAQFDQRLIYLDKSLKEIDSLELRDFSEFANPYISAPELTDVVGNQIYISNRYYGGSHSGPPPISLDVYKSDLIKSKFSRRLHFIVSDKLEKGRLRQSFVIPTSEEWYGVFSGPLYETSNCSIVRISINSDTSQKEVVQYKDELAPILPGERQDCGRATVLKFGNTFWQLGKYREPILNPIFSEKGQAKPTAINLPEASDADQDYLVQKIDRETVALFSTGKLFVFDMSNSPSILIKDVEGLRGFCRAFAPATSFSMRSLAFTSDLYSTEEKSTIINSIYSSDICKQIEAIQTLPALNLKSEVTSKLLIEAGLGKDSNVLNTTLMCSSLKALNRLNYGKIDSKKLLKNYLLDHPEHSWKLDSVKEENCRDQGWTIIRKH